MGIGQTVIYGSVRGIIESVNGVDFGQKPYGIRLENGNFRWCNANEFRPHTPNCFEEKIFNTLKATHLPGDMDP